MPTHTTPIPAALANADVLPNSAMVDVKTVSAILGRSVTAIWRDSRNGKMPRPVKTGPATTRWNLGAIRRHLAALSGDSQ